MEFKTYTDSNTLIMSFESGEPFNANILIDAEKCFKELDNDKDISVQLLGNIPFEILAYVLEVSMFCQMNILIPDDERGYNFLIDLKDKKKLKTKIRRDYG